MMNARQARKRTACAGAAAVEFAIMLPLLILLAFPVTDLARVVQANMILTNISREGANLASRTTRQEQEIMDALADTAPPLDMRAHGTMRITKIMGLKEGSGVRNIVVGQHKWHKGAYAPPAGVWGCGAAGSSWAADGSCRDIPTLASAPTADVMTGMLADGEVVFVVEGYYRLPMLFTSMDLGFGAIFPGIGPDLHAMTIL
jgi:hypothetical protein